MTRRVAPLCLIVGLLLCTAAAADEKSQEKKASAAAPSARAPRKLPGLQVGGKILLPTQWSLKPAGKQLKLGDFPVNIALHPTEPWAAILHAGYGDNEVVIIDLKKLDVVSRVQLPQAFYGLCFDNDGKRLFASGAEHQVVHQFKFAAGYLSEHHEISLSDDPKEKLVSAGLTCSRDGKSLYVAVPWGDRLTIQPLADGQKQRQVSFKEDSYPYASFPSPDAKRLFVSLWARGVVALVNLETLKVDAEWTTPSHPTEMTLSADGERLFVACANSNQVAVLDAKTGQSLELITTALYPQAPNGSTPGSLCLSPDGKVLVVANADNNNLAVIDVSERGRSRSLGFIPVGWYPTSVRFSAADNRIYVANGKGLSSKANVKGPNPVNDPPQTIEEYIAGLMRGTLSSISPPSPAEMAAHTRQAYDCSPLRQDNTPVGSPREANNPIPAKVGDPSPIKHCIYIVKENRTYDQIFGDMPEGNGDPELCIFPEKVTPNHHALAREFVLLDNFYVEGEVSADGHEWTMAAYATDFVEKTWPLVYRGGGRGVFRYPSEGGLSIAFPSSGYLWDRCKEAGVSYYTYGEFVTNGKTPDDPAKARLKVLEGHFDPKYRSFDLEYPDVKRAVRFLEELARYEKEGKMPQLMVVRLPNDHTAGTSPGKPTPTAMVADNDLALGRVVEAISHSSFWKDTAIFSVEDDAQNGSDHVDAHRTIALVISPYTKRHAVDSNMYSTASMLRTMELILGLKPMSQFDAAALPMAASFKAQPDLAPYKHLKPQVDLMAKNRADAWGAELSQKFDLEREDAADDLLLNEVVWKSVRGPKSVMPPPVRASFFFARPPSGEDEDDDD